MRVMVEFLCKFPKEESLTIDDQTMDELDAELKIQEIIKGDQYNREKEKLKFFKDKGIELGGMEFEVIPLLINLKDVETANPFDKETTILKTYTGDARILKLPYSEFKMIYQTLMHSPIHSFTDGIKGLKNG